MCAEERNNILSKEAVCQTSEEHILGPVWKSVPVLQAKGSKIQQGLSASVIVANDIPMLLVMEACQDRQCPEVSELRQYRLDTVDDTERMPGSLQLLQSQGKEQVFRQSFTANAVTISLVGPAASYFSWRSILAETHHSQIVRRCAGSVLPPRHLPAHALVEWQLLAHAKHVVLIQAQESHNLCATLDKSGVLLVWQLNPLQPLHCIGSRYTCPSVLIHLFAP